jgi:hypothetical protein
MVCQDRCFDFVFIFPRIELAFEARSELSKLYGPAAADADGGVIFKKFSRNKYEYFNYIVN